LEAIHKKSPHAMLYGADITRVAIKSAKKRLGGKARISIQDIAKLMFPKGYFDAVICSDVLEHVYNYKEVISELKRVTRKQGLFIVSYPNEFNLTLSRFFLAIKPAKAPDHVNSLTPWKIKKQVGLSLTKQLSLPLNLPFVFALECVQVFKR
jgi:2-polyprenyl-3-methyl-5-hydroxy-6-metoxy-1,4-benzoquinol methylase